MRYALWTVREGALVLGDPERRHLVLTPRGLSWRTGGGWDASDAPLFESGEHDWPEVATVFVDAEEHRFRWPGVAHTVLHAVYAWFGSVGDAPETSPVHLRICPRSAQAEPPHPVDRDLDGYLGTGYWRPALRASQALLDLLASEPSLRTALARPEDVLRAVRATARHSHEGRAAHAVLRARLTALPAA